MKKIIVLLFVSALAFVAKDAYPQCVDMAGAWNYSYAGTANCTVAGQPHTIPANDSGTVTITQNGCSITVLNDRIPNQGTVSGNTLQLSGAFLGSVSGWTFTQDSATVSGTISADHTNVTATGSGYASGTAYGFPFQCTGTGIQVALTRNLPLILTKSGTGTGTITSSPSGINCGSTCSASYESGTPVTLTATPDTGSTFTGWSDGGCSGTGSCSVTMTAATQVTATFTHNQAQQYTLTVLKAGAGSGTVIASGITCGGTCSASYDSGTSVTLTATPDAGSYFAGWSSPCSGNGTCTVTMNGDTSLSATFNPEGYPFIDVPSTHWAFPYIYAIYNAHITTGYGGTNEFKPDYEITREQMAGFIVRTKTGEPPTDYCASGSPFTDVASSSWSCIYIKKLYDLGLTTGYGGTSEYKPALILTREQMATAVIRALEGEPSPTYCDSGSPFTDVPITSWSCKYIKRLYERGITTGYGGTTEFKPALTVTRAQMATFIARAFLGVR